VENKPGNKHSSGSLSVPSSAIQSGPQSFSEILDHNQCVFLRGFYVKDRIFHSGVKLKAAAGYHDPGKHGPEEEGAGVLADDEGVTVESLSPSTHVSLLALTFRQLIDNNL